MPNPNVALEAEIAAHLTPGEGSKLLTNIVHEMIERGDKLSYVSIADRAWQNRTFLMTSPWTGACAAYEDVFKACHKARTAHECHGNRRRVDPALHQNNPSPQNED